MISTTGPSEPTRRPLPRRGSPGPAAGFTLIELVFVMMVICTVLAIGAPSLRRFASAHGTADSAREMVALAEYARTQAISEGRPYRLNVDATAGAFWLTAQTQGAYIAPATEFGRVFALPEGETARWESPSAAATRGYTTFYPDGRAEAVTILLTGRNDDTAKVVCLAPAEAYRVITQDDEERAQ